MLEPNGKQRGNDDASLHSDDSAQSDPDVECCDQCGETEEELFFCQPCDYSIFCTECWGKQLAHSSGTARKRGKFQGSSVVHEKTKLSVARVVQPAFTNPTDREELLKLLTAEEAAAWLGVDRERHDGAPLFLHDYGRLAELLASTNASRAERSSRQVSMEFEPRSHRAPSLVSFVGQTAAGKSTLIKLLLHLNRGRDDATMQTPVTAVTGQDQPTTEDVHLYLSGPFESENPILYADCEGLGAGETDPLSLQLRAESPEDGSVRETISSANNPFRNWHKSERELVWATEPEKRTRSFLVSEFYPRILSTFSDTIVFVDKNSSAAETHVLENLVRWAAAALETSSNQPVLPSAIIVLNQSENEERLYDIDIATSEFLEGRSTTVLRNNTFKDHASIWRKRGKTIDTLEDLLLCYYRQIRVVRIPLKSRPNLLHDQVQKLHKEIVDCCATAREQKEKLRMLLDAETFQTYLQHAMDHYCVSLDQAFDFIQTSVLLHHGLSSDFGENILKLAVHLMHQDSKPRPPDIFKRLTSIVASCIMLDAVRNNILGASDHIIREYLQFLDTAVADFYNKHWPCEFHIRITDPAQLHHLNALQAHHNMRVVAVHQRCCNSRAGHPKGHQLKDGTIFAPGPYQSRFSVSAEQKEFQDWVYLYLKRFLEDLGERTHQGFTEHQAAIEIHQANASAFHTNFSGFDNQSMCLCCLIEPPEYRLSCGHLLCLKCVQAYGRVKGPNLVQITECPLETYGRCQPRSVYFMPYGAGPRILSLDDGGIRSIVQIEILRLLEREFLGKLPIQLFFDLIVGKGSGAIIALGLTTKEWTIEECMEKFVSATKDWFKPENSRALNRIMPGKGKLLVGKYGTNILDSTLRSIFGEDAPLFGAGHTATGVSSHLKVAVVAGASDGQNIVFGNYNRQQASPQQVPYRFHRPDDRKLELMVWEACRATLSNQLLFRSFKHNSSKQIYHDNQTTPTNPAAVAHTEAGLIWPNGLRRYPDVLVSIGTGRLSTPPSILKKSKSIRKKKVNSSAPPGSFEQLLDGQPEREWQNLLSFLPGKSWGSNFVRLNLESKDSLPLCDSIDDLTTLRDQVSELLSMEKIQKLASQLFANLFYFERIGGVEETSDNKFWASGNLFCRIPNGAHEIAEIGKLLREWTFGNFMIVFQESRTPEQRFIVPTSVLDDMERDLNFRVPRITVRLSQRLGTVNAYLPLRDGRYYSIGGFPRQLVKERTKQPSSTVTKNTSLITPRPIWTAPDESAFPLDEAVSIHTGASASAFSQGTGTSAAQSSAFYCLSGANSSAGSHSIIHLDAVVNESGVLASASRSGSIQSRNRPLQAAVDSTRTASRSNSASAGLLPGSKPDSPAAEDPPDQPRITALHASASAAPSPSLFELDAQDTRPPSRIREDMLRARIRAQEVAPLQEELRRMRAELAGVQQQQQHAQLLSSLRAGISSSRIGSEADSESIASGPSWTDVLGLRGRPLGFRFHHHARSSMGSLNLGGDSAGESIREMGERGSIRESVRELNEPPESALGSHSVGRSAGEEEGEEDDEGVGGEEETEGNGGPEGGDEDDVERRSSQATIQGKGVKQKRSWRALGRRRAE